MALGQGRLVTSGTGQVQFPSVACEWVIVTAEMDNTGVVVIGGTGLAWVTWASRTGTPLNPGDSVTFTVANLDEIFLRSAVVGDGVTYTYRG